MFGLFRDQHKAPEVRSGAVFRHNGPGQLIETAKVIQVQRDALGIPHVRFDVMFEQARDERANFKERRTLNLATFATRFTEAVEV